MLFLQANKISGTNACAQRQQNEYWAMLPWERTSASRPVYDALTDADGAVMAAVYVAQEGVPKAALPKARSNGKVGWRIVGAVSAPDDASLSAAVARQRELIVGWAEEVVRDKQDIKQLKTGRGAPPIRVAWGKPANMAKWMLDTSYEGEQVEVPEDAPVADNVRCGFMGEQFRLNRQVGGSRGGKYLENKLPR